MKKIILASCGFEKNQDFKNYILTLLSKPVNKLSVVIITTASVEWKERNKHAVLAKKVMEEMGFKKVTFLDVELEDPSELKKYDLIYINGGNPFYLLYHLKKSAADRVIIQLANHGVVIVGVSAGAVVLGPNINIVDYLEKNLNIVNLNDLNGLYLTDIIIYPHYTDQIEKKIKMFESKFKVKIERLLDDQSIIVEEQ